MKAENLSEASDMMDEYLAACKAIEVLETCKDNITSVKLVFGLSGVGARSHTVKLPESVAHDWATARMEERRKAALKRLKELGVDTSMIEKKK